MFKILAAKLLELLKYKNVKYAKRHGMIVGESCLFDTDIWFGSEPELIEIGNHVRLTKGVKFITHDGSMWVIREVYPEMAKANKYDKISIGHNVNIGWETTILPNVKIGNNVIIGAGSIVTKDIPDNSVATGVPCRVIGTIDDYYQKNKNDILFHESTSQDKRRKLDEYIKHHHSTL